MDPDETWHADRPRPWPHCVKWGPSFPHSNGCSPHFSAHVCCGQTAGWIKMALGMEVGLSPGHIGLDGDPAPPPLKGHSLQFSAHVLCGQSAGWTIKMPLGIEVGLGPGDFVLARDAASPQKRVQPPTQFSAHVYCGQTAG